MKKTIVKIMIFVLFIITFFVTGAYAWYALQTAIDLKDMEGNILTSYFHCGTGEEDDPYVITRPVHLYNLTMLYQELEGFDTSDFYFQIGYDLDGDGDLEVYSYNDNNKLLKENDLPKYTDTLNMAYYDGKFVPIGTTDFPFNGIFNGNSFIINNLTVTGEGEGDIGFFGYVGLDAKIQDLYLTNLTIDASGADPKSTDSEEKNHTEHEYTNYCYVGYLAGHVETWTSFSNIYLNNTSIIGPAGTELINKYGYFGYCGDGSDLDEMVWKVKGDQNGFGGSIGMDELYTRIASYNNTNLYTQVRIKTGEVHYFSNGTEDTSKFREIYTDYESYEYYNNDLTGRIVYGQTQENYLWGIREHSYSYTITNEIHSDDDEIVYYGSGIRNGTTRYLYFTGGNASYTTTEADKTILFVDRDGFVYYKYNNSNYYLYASSTTNTTLRSSNSKQTYMFKISGNQLRLYEGKTAQNRYVRFNNGNYDVNGTATNILTQTTDYKTEVKTETRTYTTNGTYLPLNVYTDATEMADDQAKLNEIAAENNTTSETLVMNGAKLNNTGYIIGGTKDMSDNYGSGVRVAQNYDYGDLYRAFGRNSDGGTNDRYSSSSLQILTHTKDDGVVYISDEYNKNTALTNNQKSLTYLTDKNNKYSVLDLGLKMYNSARLNLHNQFGASTSKLYVLRYNEFQISLDNTVTAEKVLINGEIKTNYVFPESCIDFSLKEKGYISFFGGGFRGGACNAFFSLFHVIRDEDDNITELKKLSQIYKTKSNKKIEPYIYKYSDGSYAIYNRKTKSYESTSLLDGYELYFDLEWVEKPGFTAVDNTCWYFEIPVNEGEYALGAVDGRTGGYMFYLDVGTAGGGSEVVENFEYIDYKDSPYYMDISLKTEDNEKDYVSPFLFSYEEDNGQNVEVTVVYDKTNDKYIVTATADETTDFVFGIMKEDTVVVINGEDYDEIDYYEIKIGPTT